MKLIDISKITANEANELYKDCGLALIIKDGKIKGFTR